MNKDLRKKVILKKTFFKLMNNAVFRKTIECEKTQSYQTCNN